MRMYPIKMDYKTFDKVLSAILRIIPFALLNSEYKNETGYFYFWDTEYVPEVFEEWKLSPPQTHENVEKLQLELESILLEKKTAKK